MKDGYEVDWCPQDYIPIFEKNWIQSNACDCTGALTDDGKDIKFTTGTICTSEAKNKGCQSIEIPQLNGIK